MQTSDTFRHLDNRRMILGNHTVTLAHIIVLAPLLANQLPCVRFSTQRRSSSMTCRSLTAGPRRLLRRPQGPDFGNDRDG
jgi:hypothetical protein